MPELKWKQDSPTEPGQYVKWFQGLDLFLNVGLLTRKDMQMEVEYEAERPNNNVWWYGPIPTPPKDPK